MSKAAPRVVIIALVAFTFLAPNVLAQERPSVIPLPRGFQPEGIATAGGNTFWVGSIPTGDIVQGDLRTGQASLLIDAPSGRAAIGMKASEGRLFVAGGPTSQAYVYDVRTGADVAVFHLTGGPAFVNDVVVTDAAAYFTDSVNPRLYVVPIHDGGGFGGPRVVPLTGDIVYEPGFNANGIDATSDGTALILVQSNTGRLFRVDPLSGHTDAVDLGGAAVTNGDGILLQGGGRLWVVQNRDNLLTLVQLDPSMRTGRVVSRTTHESFDVPTTVAAAGDRLALVNARFGTVAEPPAAEYWVSQLERPT